jgi:2-phosphosulfolactate phosphatase
VYPYRVHDQSRQAFAESRGAIVADGSDPSGPSLCPNSIRSLAAGTSVVLPSPNGAACALSAADLGAVVAAGCLRNASAAAAWADRIGPPIAVIACGEIWRDGSLLPAVEDILGAGAILNKLTGIRSPEAALAETVYRGLGSGLSEVIAKSSSGLALSERGHADDVAWATEVNVSDGVPVLVNGAFGRDRSA